MPDLSQALRVASDELLRDLRALEALEGEKRELSPGDPRIVDLSAKIEEIAGRVLTTSTRQRAITEELQDDAESGPPDPSMRSVEATPRSIATILAEWREAERQLGAADPGSADEREAQLLCDRLREEYRLAHEEARRARR